MAHLALLTLLLFEHAKSLSNKSKAFSHDVTHIVVPRDETAAISVPQTSPVGVDPFL